MYFHILPCHDNFKLPTSGFDPAEGIIKDPDAVGFDLYAPEGGFIDPLHRKLIKLGFKSAFTVGYVGLLLDRSGMGNKGITRFAGVIDPNYRDEWGVILYNSNHEQFTWKPGDRLIQVVFVKHEKPIPTIVTELEGVNRGGGFGSTGA